MRVVRILALLVLVLPLLALIGVALALDPLVRDGVTGRASEALGVPVTLNDADASLAGRVSLERLSVANPAGYGDPHALRVQSVSAEAKPLSLLTDVVEVETLRIERPLLSIEFRGLESNVGALIDRLPPKSEEKGKRFRIGRLTIDGAEVRFTSDRLPGGTKTVTLPPIEMTNVGTAEDAASMGQLAGEVLQALLHEGMKLAADLPAELMDSLGRSVEKGVEEALDRAKDTLEDVPGLLEDRVRRGVDDLRKKKAE